VNSGDLDDATRAAMARFLAARAAAGGRFSFEGQTFDAAAQPSPAAVPGAPLGPGAADGEGERAARQAQAQAPAPAPARPAWRRVLPRWQGRDLAVVASIAGVVVAVLGVAVVVRSASPSATVRRPAASPPGGSVPSAVPVTPDAPTRPGARPGATRSSSGDLSVAVSTHRVDAPAPDRRPGPTRVSPSTPHGPRHPSPTAQPTATISPTRPPGPTGSTSAPPPSGTRSATATDTTGRSP